MIYTDSNFKIIDEMPDMIGTERCVIMCCKRYLKEIKGNEHIFPDITSCPVKIENLTDCPFLVDRDLKECQYSKPIQITVIANYMHKEPKHKQLEAFLK